MADPATIAERARHNGGDRAGGEPRVSLRDRLDAAARGGARRGLGAAGGGLGQIAGTLAGVGVDAARVLGNRLAQGVSERLTADLDDRDPDYVRERLPLSWLFATLWYRAEVRNLGNIPETGPVLLVGNHTGGNMAPETFIFTLAFSTYFSVERRYNQLAHNLVLASPLGPFLRRFGTVAASHANAQRALDAGAAVLVFPGGDWEVHRPSWQGSRIDFAGRKGFIRLAAERGVPIVPVVTIGGQETALWLSRGDWLARLLRLDTTLRLKVLPILIAPPWGLDIGDLLPRIPLPAKVTIEVLPAIDLAEQFGPEPDVDDVYDHIVRAMQDALDSLAAERRFPIIG
jgi:1-acyl-sn-glycerol-3-phosphate acyltransferase